MFKMLWSMESPENKSTHVPETNRPLALAQPSRGFVPHTDAVYVAPIPRLVTYSPYMQRSIVLTSAQEWVIGRNKDSSICLPDRWASRNHSVLRLDSKGGFNLVDLESLNGTFVNSQKISKPFALSHQDIITIGETEIEFIYPEQQQQWIYSDTPNPWVVMTHISRAQGDMWREILNSQGISTIWATSHFELEKVINHIESIGVHPNMLMLDLGMPKTNPYDFCRRYHANYPDLKIILLNGMRQEVFMAERKWAKNQGATDLFAALPKEHLFAELTTITEQLQVIAEAINWPLSHPESLTATLLQLQSRIGDIDSGFF